CEVLVLEEPHKLAFSWSGAPGLPSTVVTFELHDLGNQTEVRFQHSGWEKLLPEQASLRDKLDQGWGSKITQRLAAAVG
ncbi:MAG: SRPBCC domain-containing protein, partial [Chloroflexi bacterium]|nr:SRPBCC domain-containing protein [Chloroflexota bacterium]